MNTGVRHPTQALFCQPMFVTKWSAIPPLHRLADFLADPTARGNSWPPAMRGTLVMQIDKLKGLLL